MSQADGKGELYSTPFGKECQMKYPTRKDGKLIFHKLYWFFQRLLASKANGRWINRKEFEEILRGN